MFHPCLKLGRALVLLGAVGLALAACGRRGPLEAPPAATSALALPDSDTGADENVAPDPTEVSPLGKPSKARQGFKVPERKFVLDPLL